MNELQTGDLPTKLGAAVQSTGLGDFAQAMALFRQGRAPEAEAVCHRILARRPRDTQALHLLGLIRADRGDLAGACDCFEQALKLDGKNSALLGAYALGLFRAFKLEEAERAARAALAMQPDLSDVRNILGSVLWRRGDIPAARSCFERVLQQAPEHSGAWGNLALLEEQSNHVEEAERMADQGLARNPQDVSLRMVRGRCLRRRGEFAEARKVFAGLSAGGTAVLRRDAEYELASCSDALGEADEVYVHAERANELARQVAPQTLEKAREFTAMIQRLQNRFTQEWVAAWHAIPASTGERPAFLVGFPRSGTTLMDSMLGAHPDIQVLEERATELAMTAVLDGLPGGYPDALRDLAPVQHAAVAQAYFRAAGAEVKHGRRLLDKSPFMTVHLGLVQRIFPDAPIVFMARHPCDVLWSCFVTNLELNPGTAQFTRLGDAVNLYCSVMALWQRYCEVLRLNLHLVRYEDLLNAPETVLRKVLDFLGLAWSDRVLKYTAHVLTRGNIKSASYAQVSRLLYQTSRDRWRRHAKHLEPFFPQLWPWCDRFGYTL